MYKIKMTIVLTIFSTIFTGVWLLLLPSSLESVSLAGARLLVVGLAGLVLVLSLNKSWEFFAIIGYNGTLLPLITPMGAELLRLEAPQKQWFYISVFIVFIACLVWAHWKDLPTEEKLAKD